MRNKLNQADLIISNPKTGFGPPIHDNFYLSVLQTLPVGVMVAHLSGEIVLVNTAYTKQFGYSSASLQGRFIQDLLLPEFIPTFEKAIHTRRNNESSIYRCKMYHQNQSIADIEVSGQPYLDLNGQVIGKVAIVRDITQELALEQAAFDARRAMQKRLSDTLVETKRSLEREQRFALEIMELLQDGFALIDAAGKFEYVNPAFAKICGFGDTQPMLGIDAMVLVHPEDLAYVEQNILGMKFQEIRSLMHRIVRADGAAAHVKSNYSLRYSPTGQAIGSLLSSKDISQKLSDDQALQSAQEQLHNEREMALTIVQTAQEGFLMLKGLSIEFVNPQIEQMLGLSAEQLIGTNILKYVHPDDMYLSENGIRHITAGQELTYRQRLIRSDGSIRTIIYFAKPRYSKHGRVFGSIGSLRDITAELESQAKVLQLEIELGQMRKKLEVGTGFSGRLETIGGMVGLMQMIAVSPVSGAILLDDSTLFFEHGRIVAVKHPELQGILAVQILVQRQHGQFQFVPEFRSANTDLNLDPTQISLEFLKQQDEHQAAAPKNNKHAVHLPSSQAAKAFISGVGGIEHFQVTLEGNQVVLRGRGMKIVIHNAKTTDF